MEREREHRQKTCSKLIFRFIQWPFILSCECMLCISISFPNKLREVGISNPLKNDQKLTLECRS
jgi:hypothetical protein